MRGKACFFQLADVPAGITPAYAGKSNFGLFRRFGSRDHPRLCGEKFDLISRIVISLGSPPPMRGKAFLVRHSLLHMRITPAYAGKSYNFLTIFQFTQDHPRLCGEKSDCRCPLDSRRGSPPPMRGKGLDLVRKVAVGRITPAYAGKSSRYRLISISSRDHPRLCGEKVWKSKLLVYLTGSPPPMRGKGEHMPRAVCTGRITPAYAGKSIVMFNSSAVQKDHPRLCGEK